jgi:hypothetical protein
MSGSSKSASHAIRPRVAGHSASWLPVDDRDNQLATYWTPLVPKNSNFWPYHVSRADYVIDR